MRIPIERSKDFFRLLSTAHKNSLPVSLPPSLPNALPCNAPIPEEADTGNLQSGEYLLSPAIPPPFYRLSLSVFPFVRQRVDNYTDFVRNSLLSATPSHPRALYGP
jgi:hypothetical protein